MNFFLRGSVFIKSRKLANFAVYCGIFSGYFISDKNYRYFSGTSCTCFGIVFSLVPYLMVCTLACFSDLKWETSHYWWVFCVKYVQLFDTAEQRETKCWNIRYVQLFDTAEQREMKGWNIRYVQLFDTAEQRETNGWNIINMSKRTILDFFQSGRKAKQSRGLYFINLWSE